MFRAFESHRTRGCSDLTVRHIFAGLFLRCTLKLDHLLADTSLAGLPADACEQSLAWFSRA